MTDKRLSAIGGEVVSTKTAVNKSLSAIGGEVVSTKTVVDKRLTSVGAEVVTTRTVVSKRLSSAGLEVMSSINEVVPPLAPPEPPKNLGVFPLTSTTATIMWDEASTGNPANSFEYSLDNGVPVNIGYTIPFQVTGLLPSSPHTFRVRSIGSEGAFSTWAEIAFSTSEGAPTPPTNLVLSNITNVGGEASWQAGSGGPAVIRYEYAVGTASTTSTALVTSATFGGLTAHTNYDFKVRAVGNDGASAWTEVPFRTSGVPNSPTSLLVTNIAATGATVQWATPISESPATGHRYEINFENPVTLGLVNSVDLTGLPPGSSITFTLQANNAFGYSFPVASVTFTTNESIPLAPVNLAVVSATSTSVTFNWQAPASGSVPTSYEYSLDNGVWITLGAGVMSITIEGLTPGSSHTLRVRSKNSVGVSSTWDTEPFTLNTGSPDAPVTLLVLNITRTSADVQWDKALTGSATLSFEYSFDFNEVVNSALIERVIFENLVPGTPHNFRVRSLGEFGTSEWSEINFTTLAPEVIPGDTRRLKWNEAGKRKYENGFDRGVLYLTDNSGVAWSGLVSVDEDLGDEGTEPLYIDGIKYLDALIMGDYSANLRALTYPDEFMQFEGYGTIGDGIVADDQAVGTFGLSYQTLIGNDTEGDNLGYKIHIVYNLTATPDTKANGTQTPGFGANEFGWNIAGISMTLPGYRPTAHVILDSRYLNSYLLRDIENILYGTSDGNARIPTIQELATLIGNFNVIVDVL